MEAREREKCTNGLRYSAVVMEHDDIQFDARAAAWTAGPSVDSHKHRVHFHRGPGQGCALAQPCAAGALSMIIVGKVHGLLCDKDGLDKVGVNTISLQCASRPSRWAPQQEIHFLVHWRSAYPYRFAAMLHPSSWDAAFTEIRVLVNASKSVRKIKGAFWTTVIRNSCLEWVLSEETLELIERDRYQYTTRVQAQVARMWSHRMSTMVTGPSAGQHQRAAQGDAHWERRPRPTRVL